MAQPAPASSSPQPSRGQWWLVALLAALLVLPFLLARSADKGFSYDEHQHIAAGALMAREGLLPYRDFPYFHTPFLPPIYAAIFQWTDYLLLSARLFNVACAALLLGLLGGETYAWVRERSRGTGAWAAAASIALVLFGAAFADNVGAAGNHEPAILACFAGFLAMLRAVRTAQIGWALLAGLLLGAAIGLRLTFAPLVAGFSLLVLLEATARQRWRPLLSALAGGLAVALAILIWFWVQDPEAMLFGTWEFARANVEYRFATGEPRTMTLFTKLRFLVKQVMRPDWPIVAAFVSAAVACFALLRRDGWSRVPLVWRAVVVLLPFLLIGGLAPSPSFTQYYLAVLPFMALAAVSTLALVELRGRWQWLRWSPLVFALAGVAMGVRHYDSLPVLAEPAKWTGIETHRAAAKLRERVPPNAGPVFTLSPTPVLEAGLRIYPALSTGPFAWRVFDYIPPARREHLGMVGEATLDTVLQQQPPAALLTGEAKRWERAIEKWGKERDFRSLQLQQYRVLWVAREKPRRIPVGPTP